MSVEELLKRFSTFWVSRLRDYIDEFTDDIQADCIHGVALGVVAGAGVGHVVIAFHDLRDLQDRLSRGRVVVDLDFVSDII